MREAFSDSVIASADSIAEELHGLAIPRKEAVILFGQSVGGLLAFETCRRLEAIQSWSQPMTVLVLGTRAPSGPPPPPEDDSAPTLMRHHLGDMPAAMTATWLAILRSDMALFSGYRWGNVEPIDSPIIAMRGSDDPMTSPEQMRGWSASSRSGLGTVRNVAGGHLPTLACLEVIQEMFKEKAPR